MSKQQHRERIRSKKRQQRTRQLLIGGAGLVIVAVLAWFYIGNSSPSASQNSLDIAANLRDSDQSFSVGTLIGQPAPAFNLPDAQGSPYEFQPGDGRKYVLAFNMGYV